MQNMTPTEALQLLSEALEPRNINAISRQGFIAIQQAIEVLATAIKKDGEDNQEIKNSGNE
jgi:predicted RNase H-like HicB family nuclease